MRRAVLAIVEESTPLPTSTAPAPAKGVDTLDTLYPGFERDAAGLDDRRRHVVGTTAGP